jgi:GxxExxY protein
LALCLMLQRKSIAGWDPAVGIGLCIGVDDRANLGIGFRADIIVDDCLLLELKSVSVLTPLHTAQMITYLRLLGIKRGYLLNFNSKLMKDGIQRVSV